MNTYELKIGQKTIACKMAYDKVERLRTKINRCLTPHFYSLEQKEYTNLKGEKDTYCMELMTTSPQWTPSLDDKKLILAFFEALPTSISSKEFEGYFNTFLKFFDSFKDKMLQAGKEGSHANI